MPSSIVQGILEAALEVVCYFVGRLVVPVISFGCWRCDEIGARTPSRKLFSNGFYNRRGNQVYLTVEATQLVGLLTILLLVVVGVLIWYLKR
jgi:hypothetical protein